MNETIQGPIIRDVGSNPPPDDSVVTRVDMSKRRFIPSVIKTFFAGKEPTKQAPPPPRISPSEELAQLEAQLPHLESQFAAAQSILEADPDRPGATPIEAVRNVTQSYRAQLSEGLDLAGQRLVDVRLLAEVLHSIDGRGLLDHTTARISQLREQLRVPVLPSAQHRKLVRAAETALRHFGEAYRELRSYEQTATISQRHQFRTPRPSYGPNYSQLSEVELRKVADFGAALPVEGK
jgi:hypothetical protein